MFRERKHLGESELTHLVGITHQFDRKITNNNLNRQTF